MAPPLPPLPRIDDSALYEQARAYVDRDVVRLTPRGGAPADKARAARAFFAAAGDPQRTFRAVQVAGTSGKGSVSAFLASILRRASPRTGLHVSPYLQVFTEKTCVDGRYLDARTFARLVASLRPAVEALRRDPTYPASVHGLAALAVTFLGFAEAGVEWGVVETGVGGRYDLVQGLDRALSVITDLGLDHTHVLGRTVEEIAWHKAGIMERGVPCVAVRGPGARVLEAEAHAVGAPLTLVDPARLVVPPGRAGAPLTLRLPALGDVEVRLEGRPAFQVRNAAVAAAAADALAARGLVDLSARHVADGLEAMAFPGRFEVVQGGGPPGAGSGDVPVVILDGAHNPQKVDALVESLAASRVPPAVVVLGLTGGREPDDLLARLAPAARAVVATEPALYGKPVAPAAELAAAAARLGLPAFAEREPLAALDLALDRARAGQPVLVTGSLYLVGQVRERWFPWPEVLLQRTSWPERRTEEERAA